MFTYSQHEISLKLIGSLSLLGLAAMFGWLSFIVTTTFVILFWGLYFKNSTKWLLKSLDISLDDRLAHTNKPNKILEQIASRYSVKTPSFFVLNNSLPLVMGLGAKTQGIIVVNDNFYSKLTSAEKAALLELAIYKIKVGFSKRIEFVTLLCLFLVTTGSKMDFLINFLTGIKNKKNHAQRNYMIFLPLVCIFIRLINLIYIRKKTFFRMDEDLYHENPHLILAYKKAQLYTPQEIHSVEPLLYAFNFMNLPTLANWESSFQRQPPLNQRIESLQKDKNLMVESLTFS